ncbi:MAG TPA: DUF2760 domain-containing protein [Candidatus Kapabacteria bacterium]|nr:DUF2760 domain-containing protein [Candidatus Kapabacteria bacterium]
MTFDPTALPATLDALHLVLGLSSVVFLALLFAKSKPAPAVPESRAVALPVEAPKPAPQPVPALKTHSPDAALQLLSLLQQEARFVDFLHEDLKGFSDAEIGAVARVVHEGGKKTLNQYFKLEPVRSETEESRVTLPAGFNAAEVRVTGNVVGQPPFTGTLVHRGWKAVEANLPKLADGHDARIIAQAEVEL